MSYENSMDYPQACSPEQSSQTEQAGSQETPQAEREQTPSQLMIPTSSSPDGTRPGTSPLGLKERRQLAQVLKQNGVEQEDLPPFLRDDVVKRSRKGKAGQIVVRRLSGVQKSTATNLARKLENDLSEGREDIIEKLEASGTQNRAIQAVAAILATNPNFSLARAVAEAGADVVGVLDTYAKGALALKKMETVLGLYKEMPNLMRDIMRHAIDEESTCEVCFGVGKVTGRAGGKTLGTVCPRCRGTGKTRSSSEHKEFAVQKVLEMSEMLPKRGGPMVQVNQAVQVNAGGRELMDRLSRAADEILYTSTKQEVPSNPYVVEEDNG